MTAEEEKEEVQAVSASDDDDGSMESFGEDEQEEEGAPVMEVSASSLVEQQEDGGGETGSAEGSQEASGDGSRSRNSGLTEESSLSEYEEDLFPEGEEVGSGGGGTMDDEGTTDDDEATTDDDDDDANRFGGRRGQLTGGYMPSSRSIGSKSMHSVEVSTALWARTWEERVKDFQAQHQEEYKALDKKLKQKEIEKIGNERVQRLFENKLFKNVDRIFKILGGAFCSLLCCTILIIIILGWVVTHDSDAPPAPTVPPISAITTVPPKLRPTMAPAMEPTVAPLMVPSSNNSTES